MTKENTVDPVMLARCYGLFARVAKGATRYLRDEGDTFSPMMDRLRRDGANQENVINAFLAVQRFLELNLKKEELFSYCDRVLFLVIVEEMFAKLGKPTDTLSFLQDPQTDTQAAAWFRALASDAFVWRSGGPGAVGELYNYLDSTAKGLWDGGKTAALGKIDFHPVREVEEVTEEMQAYIEKMNSKGLVH